MGMAQPDWGEGGGPPYEYGQGKANKPGRRVTDATGTGAASAVPGRCRVLGARSGVSPTPRGGQVVQVRACPLGIFFQLYNNE